MKPVQLQYGNEATAFVIAEVAGAGSTSDAAKIALALEPPRNIDAHGKAVVLVGEHGRILQANSGAEAIFTVADALIVESGHIRAVRVSDDVTFQGLIEEAIAGRGRGGMMLLPRRSGRRDYVVIVRPLRAPTPQALVTIATPENAPEPGAGWLKRLFGLTTAEARLAIRLFGGLTPDEAARHLGVSTATIRVHLAHIFRKTRTSRQSELIRLLMSYPWDELNAVEPRGTP
jgi:DNA-binding CsgD family transcriptional regulator